MRDAPGFPGASVFRAGARILRAWHLQQLNRSHMSNRHRFTMTTHFSKRQARNARRLLALLLIYTPAFQSGAAADFSGAFLAGYNGGISFRLTGAVENFAVGFPLAVEFGVGHTRLDPGIPMDARHVFINDNTNGTPDESGYAWDIRLDFLYDLKLLKESRTFLFAGVRGSFFTGTFNFIGGNEKFDVTTEQVGLGAGLKGVFAMGRRLDLVLSVGGDYFFPATLSGHDTSYGPDGEDVNPRDGYDYDDANAAVNQPTFEPVFLVGIGYRF